MEKLEILKYLQTIKDKSGGFKKEESIRKRYPKLYEELSKIKFPDNFTFVQKLWHFLQDDYTIHKCKCGNELKFIDIKNGYRTFCSNRKCPYVLEYNKMTLQKAQKCSRNTTSRQKAVETIKEKNGGVFWSEENIQKLKDNFQKNKNKFIQAVKDSYLKTKEHRALKTRNTIKNNILIGNSIFNIHIKGSTSSTEIKFYQYLTKKFNSSDIISQYFNKIKYPYACDFYIQSLDLYIEIQGHWTHGKHSFDSTNNEDIKLLEYWKSKNNNYYNNAIYVWTDLDVRKRNIAKINELNYLEIFSNNINEIINIF